MKSRTSFFNPFIIQKNIRRFLPLWGIYLLWWLLQIMGIGIMRIESWEFASLVANTLPMMCGLHMVYALICAQVLFRDLYTARLCNSLHALPLRREGWFFAHVLCGLGFSLVPHLLMALVLLLGCGSSWAVAPLWLLGMFLQFLFFFGVAVFSAYCVGKGLAQLLVYGLINFLSELVYWVLDRLYLPLLPGVPLDIAWFRYFSPVTQMGNFGEYIQVKDITGQVSLGAGWGYLWVCAAIGIAFLALALLIYRKRPLETAGDFLAVGWLRPVFLILSSLLLGIIFYQISYPNMLFPLVLGLAAGWIIGKMLLERTVRVFYKKSLLGCLVLVLALLMTMGITKMDILGATTWLPERGQIQSVSAELDVYSEYSHMRRLELSDSDAIERVLTIHKDCIENAVTEENLGSSVAINLRYTLKNGKTVYRAYRVEEDSLAHQQLKFLFSRMEYVLDTSDPDAFWASLQLVTDDEGTVLNDHAGLYAALQQDAREGKLAQEWRFYSDEEIVTELHLTYRQDGYTRNHYIHISTSCTHTVAWLEANGFVIDTASGD